MVADTENKPRANTMRGRQATERKSNFGKWLYAARSARGWNMRRTAEEAGLSHVRISQIETGDGGDVPRDTVKRLAMALYSPGAQIPYDRFEGAAMRAAGFTPEEDDERAHKNAILIEAYWNLPPRDKRIVDEVLLYTDVHTGQQYTMDDINQMLEDDK